MSRTNCWFWTVFVLCSDWARVACSCFPRKITNSGKDKGGPSKGGFLNNLWFSSWIIYYLYTHTIIFTTQIYIRIWKSSIIQETTSTRTTFVLRQQTQNNVLRLQACPSGRRRRRPGCGLHAYKPSLLTNTIAVHNSDDNDNDEHKFTNRAYSYIQLQYIIIMIVMLLLLVVILINSLQIEFIWIAVNTN